MKKNTYLITGVLVLTMGAAGVAMAHGDRGGKGGRGAGIERMFEEVDANADGKITAAEMEAAAAARFGVADTDGDGFLSPEEVAAQAQKRMEERDAKRGERMQERQTRMFERLDENEDGKLSLEEMAARGEGRGFDRMLERLDTDGDGAISKAEAEEARGKRFGKRGHGDQ